MTWSADQYCECSSGTPMTFIGCRWVCDVCNKEIVDEY